MIAIVLGTRAELIKTFPLMKELDKQSKPYVFIHTGQHNLSEYCKMLKIREPDITLTPPPSETSKFAGDSKKALKFAYKNISRIKKVLRKIYNLNYVIYHGDTMNTTSAAIAASKFLNRKKTWKSVHLEAGLRSFNLREPFPEELSRRISDKRSDILLCPSEFSTSLMKKKFPKKTVLNVGNTVVDSAVYAKKLAKKTKKPAGNYCLVTIHRHENIKNEERMKKLVAILTKIPCTVLFSLHDNTKKQLIKFKLLKKIIDCDNIKIMHNRTYPEFIYLMQHCKFIITDGGSIQEESLVFKKPCLIMRMNTERPEGLTTGINFLTKFNVKYSLDSINKVLDKKYKIPKFDNPYGDPGVSKKIAELLE